MKLSRRISFPAFLMICFWSVNILAQELIVEKLVADFRNLRNFGYNFFDQDSVNNFDVIGPVNPDYLVRTGDEVVIDVWGDLNFHYVLPISNDGYIDIPNVHRVFLNGNTFAESKQKIIRALGSVYSSSIDVLNAGTGSSLVDISLGKTSGVTIYISGEAKNPGVMTAKSSDASIIQILKKAGGINLRGSLRNITIRKINGRTLILDLYDFLIKGIISPDYKYLDDEDIIFIPLKKMSVSINGAVRRPGIYELKEKENLRNLIEFAGGFLPYALTTRIQIVRTSANLGSYLLDIEIPENNFDRKLQTGDKILIATSLRTKIENIVRIEGEGIRRPGVYQYKRGMKLDDLINLAGGLHPDFYVDRAELVRKKTDLRTEIRQIRISESLNDNDQENFLLKPMDLIITYSEYSVTGGMTNVTVEGHVKRPGIYELHENLSLYDLLFIAGGFEDPMFRKDTYLDRADIIRFDETTQLNQIISFSLKSLLNNPSEQSIKLQGGDLIKVYKYDQIKTKEFVYIYGEVNNPGKYELKENMSLSDLITTAGSFTDLSFIRRIDLSRVIRNSDRLNRLNRSILVLDYTENINKSYLLELEDIITVRIDPEKQLRKFVHITGEVNIPGTYVLFTEGNILSLIEKAEGLKRGAFIEGARFFRNKQRLSIDLNKAFNNPESDWNLILLANDSLHLPIKDYSISIEGEVFFPKKIQYSKGKKSGYYIELAGGITPNADKKNIKIITPSGIILQTKRFLPDPEVPYGSRIIVPAKLIPEKKGN